MSWQRGDKIVTITRVGDGYIFEWTDNTIKKEEWGQFGPYKRPELKDNGVNIYTDKEILMEKLKSFL